MLFEKKQNRIYFVSIYYSVTSMMPIDDMHQHVSVW